MGARCVNIGDLLMMRSIGAKRGNFSATFCNFQMATCTMTTLVPPKLVENKFSRTSRLSKLVLHKKLCRADFSKVKSIRRVASNSNLRPAVDRQPGSPREKTRREGSARSPSQPARLLEPVKQEGVMKIVF